MKDLIKALTILQSFLKNPDAKYPTACEHDVLYVCSIDFNKITANDIHTLSELGFFPGSDEDADIFIKYNDDGEYIGEIDFESPYNPISYLCVAAIPIASAIEDKSAL